MKVTKLLNNERVNGFTHYFDLDHTDFAVAATSLAATLVAVTPGFLARGAGWDLLEEFDGGATSELVLQLGYDLAAGSDDADAFLTEASVHADATPVRFKTGTGAALANAGGYVFLENADIELHAVATGANLNALTQGKVRVFLDLIDLTKVARQYVPE